MLPKVFSSCGTADGVATIDCVFPLIATVIAWFLAFSGIVAVVLIIFSGIKLIFSSGDPKKIVDARKILIFAILGLILIFSSFAIISLIARTTGVLCLEPGRTLSFTTCGGAGVGGPTACGGTNYGTCPTGRSCVYDPTERVYGCQ